MLPLLSMLLLPVWVAAPPPAAPTSVALHRDRVVVGTERGLYVNEAEGWSLVLTRGGVRDLARSRDHLLIATGAGLYTWEAAAEEPAALPLGVGARVRAVASDHLDTEWVAGESGLYLRPRQASAFRRERSLPAGDVESVRTSAASVWAAMSGVIWRRAAEGPFERVLGGVEEGWWEIRGAVDLAEGSLLCMPRGLWKLEKGSARRLELGIGELRSIVRVAETIWVASERGVYPYALSELESAAPEAAVHADAVDLLRADDRLLVATRSGVATLRLGARPEPVLGLSDLRVARSDIRNVQRAVLSYLDLSPRRIAVIEERARRSAWIPQVRATLSLDRARERDREHDEVFSSGSVRNLLDMSSERDHTIGFDLNFVWELARNARPDQALDISRERRQLVELRDQVLERVNRLYFERLRVLMRLAALDREAAAERVELGIRARELAAHLDAWSGGAFSRLERGAVSPTILERERRGSP